jgi:hypothetical protein
MTNSTEPELPPSAPVYLPAPGVYEPDNPGPLPNSRTFNWIRSGISVAVFALFFTGFVSPGFLHHRPVEQADTVSLPTVDPTDEFAAPSIPSNLSPDSKGEVDQFIRELNYGDVEGASALLCPQSSVNPDVLKQAADSGHQLAIRSYSALGDDVVSAEFSGPATTTSAYDLSGDVTAGTSPTGLHCVSSLYLSS